MRYCVALQASKESLKIKFNMHEYIKRMKRKMEKKNISLYCR